VGKGLANSAAFGIGSQVAKIAVSTCIYPAQTIHSQTIHNRFVGTGDKVPGFAVVFQYTRTQPKIHDSPVVLNRCPDLRKVIVFFRGIISNNWKSGFLGIYGNALNYKKDECKKHFPAILPGQIVLKEIPLFAEFQTNESGRWQKQIKKIFHRV
jgi:hypothetical protein